MNGLLESPSSWRTSHNVNRSNTNAMPIMKAFRASNTTSNTKQSGSFKLRFRYVLRGANKKRGANCKIPQTIAKTRAGFC